MATAGRYTATAWYTCPAADVGSTIELRFGDSRVTAKVAEPNDPPLVGAENDRVPREGESLVKDFKPLELGVITLPAEQGELTLRALSIPANSVMDLRGITLELLID